MSEEFATRNAPIIKKLWSEVAKPYNVTEHEFLGRLAAVMANITAKNSSPRTTELDSSPHIPEDDHQQLATIKAGELCFMVFASAPHRAAAREAVAWVVDRIKAELPIFGREVLSDANHVWKVNRSVDPPGRPTDR